MYLRARMTTIFLVDLGCLLAGSAAGVWLRLERDEMVEYVFQHREGWLLLFSSILLAHHVAGTYRLQHTLSRFNVLVTWAFSILTAFLVLSVFSYAWLSYVLGRGVLLLSFVFYSLLALPMKLTLFWAFRQHPRWACRVLIVGTGPLARTLCAMVENRHILPRHRVVAWVRPVFAAPSAAPYGPTEEPFLDARPVVEAYPANLKTLAQEWQADLILLGLEDSAQARVCYAMLKHLRFAGVEVLFPLQMAELYTGRLPLSLLSEETFMAMILHSAFPATRRLKRILDVFLSAAAVVLLAPVGLLLTLLLKASAPGWPVFYSQTRVGQFGRVFRVYKFRTMRPEAEAETGPVWSPTDDPRVTRIGRILRRFRLDELPQLLNVLRGDMSLVGPRPERPELTAQLEKRIPFYSERHTIPPGLTGWAQVQYPYGDSETDAIRKLEYDLYYLKNYSLTLDLQILLSTLRVVLFGSERRL